MNRKEFATMASMLREYYAKENILQSKQVIELWFSQVQDIPVELAKATLNKWIATQKWSPSIAEFRKMACEIAQGEPLHWSEAWKNVQSVIRRYGSWRASEAKAELDEPTWRAVERLGYNELCNSTNTAVDRANFRMIYEQLIERKTEREMLPESVRMQLDQIFVKHIKEIEHEAD